MECPPTPQFCLSFLLWSYLKQCPASASIAIRKFSLSIASLRMWEACFARATSCKLHSYIVLYSSTGCEVNVPCKRVRCLPSLWSTVGTLVHVLNSQYIMSFTATIVQSVSLPGGCTFWMLWIRNNRVRPMCTKIMVMEMHSRAWGAKCIMLVDQATILYHTCFDSQCSSRARTSPSHVDS